jgi:hypothetical protein
VYPLLFVENCSLIDQFRKYELATELRDSAKLSLRSLYKAVEQIDPSLCTCDCLNGLNEELNHWDRPYKRSLASFHAVIGDEVLCLLRSSSEMTCLLSTPSVYKYKIF